MTPEQATYLAYYKPHPPTNPDDKLRCTHCEQWSILSKWRIGYIDCETCGCSEAMECPLCDEVNGSSHTHDDPIQVISK